MEEILSQSLKNTQGQLDRLAKEVDEMQKRHEVTMKNMEVQMGKLSSDLANATRFVRSLFASGGGIARGEERPPVAEEAKVVLMPSNRGWHSLPQDSLVRESEPFDFGDFGSLNAVPERWKNY